MLIMIEMILKAIEIIESEDFQNSLKMCNNPYGDGKASMKIYEVLKSIELDNDLLNKKFFDII